MDDVKTNKISVYLLKEGATPLEAFGKDYKIMHIDESSTFYYDDPHINEPAWIKSFFAGRLSELNFRSGGSKGVFFTKLVTEIGDKYFAVPFGYGHSMLNKIHFVDDFGLKIVLNVAEKIRKIETRTLSSTPKNTIEQLSMIGDLSDFAIDTEQDMIEEITAKPRGTYFGENLVTGKVAFTASVKVDIGNISDFLAKCLEYYEKDDYKERFAFIDQVKEVRNSDQWNSRMIERIRGGVDDDVIVWMAIPEVIEWPDVSGFSYNNRSEELATDLFLEDFVASLSSAQLSKLDVDALRKRSVMCFSSSSEQVIHSWPILNCLYCEISDNGRKYLLSNGRWYEIAKDFVDIVNSSYEATMAESSGLSYIGCGEDEYEDSYNTRLTEDLNGVLMDRKLIMYGGGSSSIEFCDVFDEENQAFIHVKNYYGSSALSHLFAQGRVSGELFLADQEFRKRVKEKEGSLSFDPAITPVAKEYKIIFGIISESTNSLNIPFFSKVNFRNIKRSLETFGYGSVQLIKIQRERV